MGILERLSKTKQANLFAFVMTDRFSKLTKAIPSTKNIATTVAHIFAEHWVANYGIPSKFPAEYNTQFVPTFFVAVCGIVGVNNITTA